MKTFQGDLIHLAQNGEFDLIVHGSNCFCTMGAGTAKGINEAFRGWCRPFRACISAGDGTQGAALGYRMMLRRGGRLEGKSDGGQEWRMMQTPRSANSASSSFLPVWDWARAASL